MLAIYRISDSRQCGNPKIRPPWFSTRASLDNFCKVFHDVERWCVADAVGDETWADLQTRDFAKVVRTSFRNGAASFRLAMMLAKDMPDEREIYFVEDDYLHLPDACGLIIEGLCLADYATLYDSIDKYVNAGTVTATGCVGNPLIQGGGELTRVLLSRSSHWKTSNSACLTFACRAKTLRRDWDIMWGHNTGPFPRDFEMFRALLTRPLSVALVCCLPARATHCETPYLAPLVDWEHVARGFSKP
jgi:hypothetical protein